MNYQCVNKPNCFLYHFNYALTGTKTRRVSGQSFLRVLYLTKANKGCSDSKMQMAKGGSEMILCEDADSSVSGSHVLFVCVTIRALGGSVLIRVLCESVSE